MQYLKFFIVLGLFFSFGTIYKSTSIKNRPVLNKDTMETTIKKIWDESSFKDSISFEIFQLAMEGFYKKKSFKSDKISIVDYSKPSSEKRFYVIDLVKKSLIYNTLVAHGKNTGENIALYFSNEKKSLKSSLGFYKTAETYEGKHGYSLKLDGLEKGINDNARERAIVIHGANYVSHEFVKKNGRLGRSWGCPAIPVTKAKEIIDAISNGTCLFIYANDEEYFKASAFLK